MNETNRASGILLHLTSLPGGHGCGDLGQEARNFVDWLTAAGQTWWQVLPVTPVGMANSPYMSTSAFAGSPLLVDLHDCVTHGWLDKADLAKGAPSNGGRVDYAAVTGFKSRLLNKAAAAYMAGTGDRLTESFEAFEQAHARWLGQYALFQTLNELHSNSQWTAWPAPFRHHDEAALKSAATQYADRVLTHKFVQWRFYTQWEALRSYARSRGVQLMGDLPIFVAHHSADVWSHQDMFLLDAEGRPTSVAGVPPDYFSETGQRWGNPLYRWDRMAKDRYGWWKDRMRASMELFDLVRIDHFRGFEAYWEIPASEKTAVKGAWVKGPGTAFFRSLKRTLGALPIVAEDLGVITPEVTAIRDAFGFPGMKVLQFAFSDGPENAFLPHHHPPNAVVYTGTHDNDTTAGWYASATEHEKDFARRYYQTDGREMHWTLIRSALQSPAAIAVVPVQDVLGLGSADRMNTPGTTVGNWEWRLRWEQMQPYHAERLYEMTALSGRCAVDRLRLVPYPEGKRRP